jgi:hypothetical protein
MDDSKSTSAFTIPLGVIASVGIMGYVFLAINLGVAFAIPVGVIGALATAAIMAGPVGKAIAQRLGLRNPAPPHELTEQTLEELDQLRARVAELEERVDFSERLLAGLPKDQGREQSKF